MVMCCKTIPVKVKLNGFDGKTFDLRQKEKSLSLSIQKGL